MNPFQLLLFICSILLIFIPTVNILSFLFKKQKIEDIFFFSFIFLLFISPYFISFLIFLGIFNRIILLILFSTAALLSFFLNKKIIFEYKKYLKFISVVISFVFIFNFFANLFYDNVILLNILSLSFGILLSLIFKLRMYEMPLIVCFFIFLQTALLMPGVFFMDTYNYIYPTRSIELGRYPFVELYSGNIASFFVFSEQSLIALFSVISGITSESIFPIIYLSFFGVFVMYLIYKIKRLEFNRITLFAFFILFLMNMDVEFRPRTTATFFIFYFFAELFYNLKNKRTDFFEHLKYSITIISISLIHTATFLPFLLFLILSIILFKFEKKLLFTLIISIIFCFIYMSIWYLPIILGSGFEVRDGYVKSAYSASPTAVSKFLENARIENIIISSILLIFLLFYFKEGISIIYGIFVLSCIIFGFHSIITLPLINRTFTPEYCGQLFRFFFPFTVVLFLEHFKFKIKIGKFFINKKLVLVLFLIFFAPAIFERMKNVLSNYSLQLGYFSWNKDEMRFNQGKENLELYEWVNKNTERDSIFLNPDEYVQTSSELWLYNRSSAYLAVYTGRKSYVITHNHGNLLIDFHNRYSIANEILWGENNTLRKELMDYIDINYITINKNRGEFNPFEGIEKVFENEKFLVYQAV